MVAFRTRSPNWFHARVRRASYKPTVTDVCCASTGGSVLTLEIRSLNNAKVARAKKGKVADLGFKPTRVTRVE